MSSSILATPKVPSVATDVKLVKTLHLINGEHFSFALRVQDLLAHSLPHFGYEVGFVCLKSGRFGSCRQTRNAPLFQVAMRNRLDVWKAREIADIARKQNYQILHAHTPRSLLLGNLAARRLRIPLVYHVHSPVGRDSDRSLQNRVNTWLENWNLRGVAQMICVSSSLRDYMLGLGHDSQRLSVVNNGVAVVDCPQRLPRKNGPLTLGTMALFRPRKGTEVLLEALAELQQEGIDVHLRAVGPFESPDYEQSIHQRAAELGIADRITWTGFQADVNAELRRMDLFVLPSLYGEGLPMVVLEAMANGTPVVASRVEGIPEAIRDGEDGLIFEPGNPADLATRVRQLWNDQIAWQRMSESALARQRESLSERSMARGVARVYKRILNRNRDDRQV